jgi:hypothetical protein
MSPRIDGVIRTPPSPLYTASDEEAYKFQMGPVLRRDERGGGDSRVPQKPLGKTLRRE